jgi:hypothetical protein
MTLIDAIAEAKVTGQAMRLIRSNGSEVLLALDWERKLLHFWESEWDWHSNSRGDLRVGCHSGLLVHADDLTSDRWEMRMAPDLQNLWSPSGQGKTKTA